MHGLQITGRRDRFIGIPFFDFKDVPGQDLKGTYQHSGDNDRSQENNDQHDCLQHKCLAPQNILGLLDVFRGSTCEQYTQDCVGLAVFAIKGTLSGAGVRHLVGSASVIIHVIVQTFHGSGLGDRNNDLNKAVFPVVVL